jgi:6-phospho-beta-glucosidase
MIGRMKLAILGGGGFRVPQVYRALLDESLVTEVVLCDPSAERLAVIETVLAQQGHEASDAPRLSSTSELAVALLGAHFVFSAIRIGGLAARTLDERIPLRLGVLGQETTGPGAVAYGLRTIPVSMQIAQQVRAWCPEAYVINFTNPAGMITEAMQRVLGSRVIGVCDTPSDLVRRIGLALGADPTRIQPDYVGLNHLGWLRGVLVGGIDLLPALLADEERVGVLDEAAIFGIPWLRATRSVPNEYLYYYYFTQDAIRSILSAGATRGEFLERQQAEFYRAAAESPGDALALWERAVGERSTGYMAEARGGAASSAGYAGGYEQVALAVVSAIARDEAATLILDVRNGPALPGMDADAVVELPTVVDRRGVHPLPTAIPDLHQLGLMRQVKAVERLTIEAATTGSRNAALEALALHPLVDSVPVARDLLRGYISAIPEVAAVLNRP